MDSLTVYLPTDRRHALARGESLPAQTSGAALFADVSGFTPLTESLLRDLGPKRGAEELTRQLNLIYDTLIAKIDRYAGSVITFSGDALTAWFDGDEGLRAVACALDMQRAMSRFAAVKTPSGGVVSLAMKATVATGPVRRLLVGDSTIQLVDVLAGATLDQAAAAEKHAHKGEVVITPATATALGDKVVIGEWRDATATDPGFAIVTRLAQPAKAAPWPALVAPLNEEQLRPWLLAPVFERLQQGQGQFLAEIRPTVALFLSFGGLDYEADPDVGAKLDGYIRWVEGRLAHYEGHLLQLIMGDKGCYLYATFGAPVAHDDDPARAVAAALELVAPPIEFNFIREVRLGLSQGRIWSGAYGGSTRRTYGVLGDAVNLAARLMGKAGAGQVWVSPEMVRATASSYEFEALGPITLKGKQEPVEVARALGRRTPAGGGPTTLAAPLIGRETELAQASQVLETALAGAGQILRVEGEPGVGKSHLAAAVNARATAQGARVAVGVCQSISRDISYAPWREILTHLFELAPEAEQANIARVTAEVHDLNPALAVRLPLLGEILELPWPDNPMTATFEPQLRREALVALVVELAQAWARTRPLVLFIEDAHWMDEASQTLTLALGRVLHQSSLMLTLTQRPREQVLSEFDPLPHHHRLALGELSATGLAALVTQRLGGPPSELALALIEAQAQGNPFFTEELIAHLRETEQLYQRADGQWLMAEKMVNALREANCLAPARDPALGQWTLAPQAPLAAAGLSLPDSVRGAILARLDRLPEAHKLTAKVASVIGRLFEMEVLTQAHPAHPDAATVLEQLAQLEQREFVKLDDPVLQTLYTFRHSVTHETVYETLLEAQQRDLHQAVADIIERHQPEAVEALAYHYQRAGARAKAMLYLDQAARQAQAAYANETALNYYSQALALEERWEWRRGQVEVLHILGRRAEELTALQVLEGSEAPPAISAFLRGQYHEVIGEYPEALDAGEFALAAYRAQRDSLGEVRCLTQLGSIAWRQGEYETAKTWYDQALALLPATQVEASPAAAKELTQALNGLGTIYRQQGKFDAAKGCYEQALALSRQHNDRLVEARSLSNLGLVAFYQQHYTEALTQHHAAYDLRHLIGNRTGEGISLGNLAMTTREAGDYAQAQQYLEAALQVHQSTGNRYDEVAAWLELGILYHELGELAQAQTSLERGLRLSEAIGHEVGKTYILVNLGLVTRDLGKLEEAETLLRTGLGLAREQADKQLMGAFLNYLGSVCLRLGRWEQAMEYANAALTIRTEINLPLRTADDLAILGEAHLNGGDLPQALEVARRALTILDNCRGEGPEFPQQDYFAVYQVLLSAGEQPTAQHALRSAYALVMKRAEKIADPDLRQSFLERVSTNRQIVEAARAAGG